MDKTKTIEISQEVYDKLKERADKCNVSVTELVEEYVIECLND